MLEISCSGTPYEIGHTHGRLAARQVRGSLSFYRDLFSQACNLSWEDARSAARPYLERLSVSYPAYVDEMRGLADGVVDNDDGMTTDLLDIVVLNVRTEIAFGLFTLQEGENKKIPMDGCTALGYVNGSSSSGREEEEGGEEEVLMAQNWDWQVEQSENLIVLRIEKDEGRREMKKTRKINMITEAGIIGKIGMNSDGVGVCQNAIRARGLDPEKLPVHLAMRMVLECGSRAEALAGLEATGTAGSVHLLVGDPTGVTGVECTSLGVRMIHGNGLFGGDVDEEGKGEGEGEKKEGGNMIVHTNHLLLDHGEGVDEPPWLEDSGPRLERIGELMNLKKGSRTRDGKVGLGFEDIFDMLRDEEGFPASINRRQIGGSEVETLFTIAMNLTRCRAEVTFGRPTEIRERVVLAA